MTVVCIDLELIHNLEGILAPVIDVYESVVEWRAVVTLERFPVAELLGGFVNVWVDNLAQEPFELAIREFNVVQSIELFPEVRFERGSIGDVGSILVL